MRLGSINSYYYQQQNYTGNLNRQNEDKNVAVEEVRNHKSAENKDLNKESYERDRSINRREKTEESGERSNSSQLSVEELQEVQNLKSRDREVKAHEQAHATVGGQYVTSGPNYEYKTGPDNQRYAVAGNVGIDSSEVPNNPEATIKKAQIVKRAALAPADPSSSDRAVASKASAMESKARMELMKESSGDSQDSSGVFETKSYKKNSEKDSLFYKGKAERAYRYSENIKNENRISFSF